MRVPPVDLAPLAEAVKSVPGVRLMILNCNPRIDLELLPPIVAAGEVYVEFSMVESVGGVARLAESVSLGRVLFGSNFPLFYLEAALLKLQESGLNDEQKKSLFEGNARRLLAPAASASLSQSRSS